jgi:DNA-binding SARP family transcriptional activator
MMQYLVELTAAWSALLNNDPAGASEILQRAFARARKYRITAISGWRPELMARLCQLALKRDIETEYVRHLIRSREIAPPQGALTADSWPWPVRIRTFGCFELYIDGKHIDCASKTQRRQLELLKAILSLGGERVATTQLLAVLWPDTEADTAFHAFESTLHRLRKLVGKESILLKSGFISINRYRVWVDALSFDEHRIGAAEQQSIEDTGNIVALYRGGYLDGDDAPWVLARREHLANQAIRLTEALAKHHLRLGGEAEARHVLERGISRAPISEPLYRLLIETLIRQQEYAEAMLVFRRCQERLMYELDLQPSPATLELRERIATAGARA